MSTNKTDEFSDEFFRVARIGNEQLIRAKFGEAAAKAYAALPTALPDTCEVHGAPNCSSCNGRIK